jgi:hypothetical protein
MPTLHVPKARQAQQSRGIHGGGVCPIGHDALIQGLGFIRRKNLTIRELQVYLDPTGTAGLNNERRRQMCEQLVQLILAYIIHVGMDAPNA